MNYKTCIYAPFLILLMQACNTSVPEGDHPAVYPYRAVPIKDISLNDSFWVPKIETNRTVTIPEAFDKCEAEGRLDNFLIAGGKMEGGFASKNPFDDTDLYKVIEGASYSLLTRPDADLETYLDSLIEIIAVGQEADGYLTTYITIDSTFSPVRYCPPGGRWKNLRCSHELYNSGHLFEAASAHHLATGKTNLLDIAIKNAHLLVRVFGDGKKPEVPGHQIVETGLVKLYQITGEEAYIKLAKQFLDLRGDSTRREIRTEYWQDHQPVVTQDEAVGHAVRAGYMYAGMTDIASLFNDEAYKNAIEKLWNNVVTKKLYITGGLGARHHRESFGENYELPNLTAYNETCAAIANVYWNHRMFLLLGDARYMDILERSLYNGVISGVGLDGKTFFYPNPLECDMKFIFNKGALTRQPWFNTSCCPTNICRFIPSVPGLIYAHNANELFVNLYIQNEATININRKNTLTIKQETNYPWEGAVKITLNPSRASSFQLKLRIPGWAKGSPVPGDLYSYLPAKIPSVGIEVNGETVSYHEVKGYAVIERKWRHGDVVSIHLPMQVQRVLCKEEVVDNRGLVAIERGPLVYCFEGTDNGGHLNGLVLADSLELKEKYEPELLGGVISLQGAIGRGDSLRQIKAIPYYAWNNRGANEMKVWINKKE